MSGATCKLRIQTMFVYAPQVPFVILSGASCKLMSERKKHRRGGPVCPPWGNAVKIGVRIEGGHTGPPLRMFTYLQDAPLSEAKDLVPRV
jgi:hypothetical protein